MSAFGFRTLLLTRKQNKTKIKNRRKNFKEAKVPYWENGTLSKSQILKKIKGAVLSAENIFVWQEILQKTKNKYVWPFKATLS